jgi:hypothetical protein
VIPTPLAGGTSRRLTRDLIVGALAVYGDLATLWPILALGQFTHAGRGATAGLGRYALRS